MIAGGAGMDLHLRSLSTRRLQRGCFDYLHTAPKGSYIGQGFSWRELYRLFGGGQSLFVTVVLFLILIYRIS